MNYSTLQSLLEWLLVLSPLKFPLGFKIYLNILPCLMGIGFLLKKQRIYKATLPVFLMCILNGLYLIYLKDWGSFFRLGQFLSLVLFSQMIAFYYKEEGFKRFLSRFIILSLAIFFLEIFFPPEYAGTRSLWGNHIYRFQGPVGETNYSAILLAGLFCLSYFKQYKKESAALLLMVIACLSRTGLVVCIIGVLFFHLRFFLLPFKPRISVTVLTVVLTFPFLIFGIVNFGSLELRTFLEETSSGRLYLFAPYVDMGFDNIFGVGYFNGRSFLEVYQKPYYLIQESIRGLQKNEQHNISIQVLSEFGPLGLGLFVWYLKNLLSLAYKSKYQIYYPMISLLLGYMFLNGLNDIIFHMMAGIALTGSSTIKIDEQIRRFRAS